MTTRLFSHSSAGRRWFVALSLTGFFLAAIPGEATAHPDDPHPGETHAPEPSANPGTADDATEASVAPLSGNTDCREMTDSIVRLYRGYLDRPPTEAELTADTDAFRSGAANLRTISTTLEESSEFATDNGKLSDDQFIDLVFTQTVQREPSETELTHWSAALDGGTDRSLMMLSVTESREFVATTQTSVPLAGYDRWYPEGTYWYCGQGSSRFSIQPLSGKRVSSDFIFVNTGVEPSFTELWVLESNFNQNVQMTSGIVPPNFSDYNWDGAFTGDGDYGDNLDLQTNDATRWIIVFYPTSIGEDRPGWELIPDGQTS